MPDLHVFSDHCEWVVAESLEDARAVLSEMGVGVPDDSAESRDQFADSWDQEDDSKELTIWCDSYGDPAEPFADGNVPVTLTFAEWAARRGRGYLCTTEW